MVPKLPLPDPRRLMGEQISALAAMAQHCPLAQLVQGIDAVRIAADAQGLGQVALLASRLESAIATRGRSAIILSYLDAMAAALSAPHLDETCCDDDAWLASVAVRFAN